MHLEAEYKRKNKGQIYLKKLNAIISRQKHLKQKLNTFGTKHAPIILRAEVYKERHGAKATQSASLILSGISEEDARELFMHKLKEMEFTYSQIETTILKLGEVHIE